MRLRRATHEPGRRAPRRGRDGFVILAVLIVVVVLSLAAYRFTDLMTAEYRAAARSGDAAQARLAARSGVYYAAAMLADPGSLNGDLGGNPYAEGSFSPQVVRPGDHPRQEARFALVSVYPDGSGGFEQRYGAVVDESSRLNINSLIQLDPSGQLLYAALMKLPNMTAEIAAAIVDWVDPDPDPREEGGAESDYYLGLASPYRAKNGPLNSIEELLLVRGVTPQVLYGTDRNRNGLPDDGGDGTFDRGLADYLTVYGRELNLDSQGQLRLNLNETEDLPGLYQKLSARLPPEVADFVFAYRTFSTVSTGSTGSGGSGGSVGGQSGGSTTVTGGSAELRAAVEAALAGTPKSRRLVPISRVDDGGMIDLMTARVTLPKPQGVPDAPTVVVPSPLADPALFAELLDKATSTTNVELYPRVNVNTAPREVLLAVPGMTEAAADAIVAQRDALDPAAPATVTGAWLVAGGSGPAPMDPALFRQTKRYLSGRTMVYRVQSVGYFGRGGPVARVEAVVDTNQGAPRVLYFRDLTDLDTPRGFEPPRE